MAHILDLQLWADDLELNRLPALNDELVAEIQARTDGWTLNSVRIDAVSDAAGLAQSDASLALSQIYAVNLGAQNALLNTIQDLRNELVQEVTNQVQAVKDETDQKIQDQIDAAVGGAVSAVGGMSADMLAQYITAMGRMDSLLLSTDHLLDTELPVVRHELALATLQVQQALSDFDLMFTDYTYPSVIAGLDEALAKSEAAKLDAAAAAQLGIDNLNLAKDYTDTSVVAEQVARVTGQEALAAQISTLTAVLNSTNYLQNPRFEDGTAGWTIITGSVNIVDRDEGSADPIIATAPTPKFARRSTPVTSAHALQQIFEIETEPGEVVQWRIWLAAAAVVPVQIRYFWLDDLNNQIGAVIDRSVTITPNEWRVYSGQYPRPAGATRLRFNILRGSTAGTTDETAQLCVADASVTKVDVSLIARITDLEVVVANNQSAQTLWQSNAESRFNDAEDELDAVAVALSNRYTKAEANAATVSATNSLKATLEGPGGSIKEALDGLVSVNATLDNDYLTAVDTNAAINLATTSLKSTMEGPGGSVKAAQDAAQAANNLAGGKGKVFFQTSAPGTAERLPQNLWIDTTGGANTPKRWSGSAWVAVTDKVATDAAAAAASALSALATKADASALANYYTMAAIDQALAHIRLDADARVSQGDLVLDGVFEQGLNKWPRGTLGLSLYERNLDSATWQYRLIPAPRAWRVTPVDGANNRWRGTGLFPVTPREEIRVSFDAARWSTTCVALAANLVFYDTAGASIPGKNLYIPVGVVNNRYQHYSETVIVPDGASNAELRFQASGSGATQNAYITNIRGLRGQQAYADGALQITAEAAPSGAVSRIGLRARAEGETVGEAAMYLEARSDGTSRIINKAREFYVYDGALEQVLFAIRDGKVVIANAMVDTLSIGLNQVTVPASASASSEIRLTGTGEEILLSVTIDRKGAPTLIWATVQMGGYVSQSMASFRLYRGGTLLAGFPSVTGSRGAQTSGAISWRDTNLGTGPTTYSLRAARKQDGDYYGDPQILNRTLSIMHVMR